MHDGMQCFHLLLEWIGISPVASSTLPVHAQAVQAAPGRRHGESVHLRSGFDLLRERQINKYGTCSSA